MNPTLLILFSHRAEAACVPSPSEPATDSVARNTATFSWTSTRDCAETRMQVSPRPARSTDAYATAWAPRRTVSMAEDAWDTYTRTVWGGRVYWRVEGRGSDGTYTATSSGRPSTLANDAVHAGLRVRLGLGAEVPPRRHAPPPEGGPWPSRRRSRRSGRVTTPVAHSPTGNSTSRRTCCAAPEVPTNPLSDAPSASSRSRARSTRR